MELIERYTVPSGVVSSIVFDEIPDTFTDLYILMSLRRANSTDTTIARITFNSSTSNYSLRQLQGSGSFGSSNTRTTLDVRANAGPTTANTFSSVQVYIPNYTSSNPKSLSTDAVTENNATSAFQAIAAGLWNDSDAINRIDITPSSGDFAEFSSTTLYGILAGSDGTTTVS